MIKFLQQQKDHARVACSLKMIYQGQMIPLPLMAARGMYVTHIFQYFGIEAMEQTPASRIANDYDTFFKALLPSLPQAGSPESFAETLLNGQIRFWQLSSVKYVVTDGYLYGVSQQPLPVFELMKRHPALKLCFTGAGFGGRRMAVFQLKDTLSQFTLLSSVEQVASPDAALERMKSPDFNPDSAAVVVSADAASIQLADSVTGSVRVTEYSPGEIRLICDASGPAILLWTSQFNKGWKARIDGHPVELFLTNFMMTGLQIESGSHQVELKYAPRSLLGPISFGVALVGLLSVPVGLWCAKKKEIE
jgi:hypothetical protein